MQDTFAFHIGVLHRSFMRYAEQILKDKGITKGQLPFLLYIGKHPGCSPSELKHSLKIDWGYSQRAITKLVENGFIIKEHIKEADCYRLDLTTAGEDAFKTCHDVFKQWDDEFLYMLSEDEKQLVMNILNRTISAIQNR